MRLWTRLLIMVGLAITLISCDSDTSTPTLANTPLPTKTATHTSSPSPTPTLEPSPTPRPDTPTATITNTSPNTAAPTPTVSSEARLEYRCLEINPAPLADGIYAGTIVLAAYQNPSYLLELSTGDMIPLLGEDKQLSYGEIVSPDRKWLAYEILEPAQIVVDSLSDEQTPIRIPWEEDWFALIGWLNNQTLLVSGEGDSPNMVIYPFSGEQDPILSDFPEYNRDPGTWFEQYNPQLTKVVYTRYPTIDVASYIALWNMKSQETITAIHSYTGVGPYGTQPVWSPSGDAFIMSLFHEDQDNESSWYTELYRISQDGEQYQVTNLRAYYTEYLFVQEYQWSPDESQVAFWLRYSLGELSKAQLAILDLETSQVINYCIDDRFGTSHELVWSPDGHQIIVNAKYVEEPAVLLLDLDRQVVHRIAGDMKAVGWLDTFP